MATGWYQEGTTWYYDQPNGDMKTGWQKPWEQWYYLRSSEFLYQEGSTWYYLHMQANGDSTGWFQHLAMVLCYSSEAVNTVDGYYVKL